MKRYIKSAINEGKEMYSVAVFYKNKCIGFVTKHFGDSIVSSRGVLYVQTDTSISNYGVWKSRLSKVKYHLSKSPDLFSEIVVLNGSSISCKFSNYRNPAAELPTSRTGGLGYRFVSTSEYAIDFDFVFKMMKSSEIGSVEITDLEYLVGNNYYASFKDAVSDFDQYNPFLEGFNNMWRVLLKKHSFEEIQEVGSIGQFFDDILPDIEKVIEDSIYSGRPSVDVLERWVERLPDPYRSDLLSKIEESV